MSLFWGFCPNLLNSPQIHWLLHTLLPCPEWWAITCKCSRGGQGRDTYILYIHWCIDIDNLWREAWSALTLAMSGLSLWDCDKHGELFLASFHLQQSLWPLLCWGQGSWPASSDQKESWEAEDFINMKPRRWHYVTAPWQAHCSLHIVTLNILKFCQGHQPSTRTLVTAIHLRWGDTGVTSINNYPGTIWELLMVTWVCAQLPGLRVELLGGLKTRFWSEWHLIPSVIVSNYSIKVSIETPCTGLTSEQMTSKLHERF